MNKQASMVDLNALNEDFFHKWRLSKEVQPFENTWYFLNEKESGAVHEIDLQPGLQIVFMDLKPKEKLAMTLELENAPLTFSFFLSGNVRYNMRLSGFRKDIFDRSAGHSVISFKPMSTTGIEIMTGQNLCMVSVVVLPEVLVTYFEEHFDEIPNDSPIVLFLDDAHLINRQIQAYLFQLLTYHTIHDHRLPEQAVMLLAGNRSVDRAGFQEILAPVANRIFFVQLLANVEQWIEDFAVPMNIRQDIITFLKHYPEYFLGTPRESEAWPSPRSWTYASQTLDVSGKEPDENILFTVLTGHVGTEAATKFIEYHKLFAKWDPNQILLAGKIPAIDHLNKIEAYALLSSCVAYLLSHLRKVNFQMNPELERELCGLIAVVSAMSKYHREIVPLGLKTLLVSEKQTTGEIGIVRRLVEEADVVAKLLEVA